ncbi:MAG TPA: carboxymuconolactone decarboxylase family protein [Alphaproteobacteria bacterium]|jgi:4-carboxymuconolactone decarboxylase
MTRIPVLDPADMTEAQRRLAEEVTGPRGGVLRGPFAVWLRVPALCERTHPLGMHFRTATALPPRLKELAVLTTARYWKAQYAWAAHERAAREAGLSKPVIEALRHRRVPPLESDEERCAYDALTELLELRNLTDETYARARMALGEGKLIELVALAGYYTMIALTVNAFEVPPPDGGPPPLA